MDGILMDGRRGRLWLCKREDGHALGLHIRVERMDVLLEFREAVEVGDVSDGKAVCLPKVGISGQLEGTKRDIECTVCGEKRTWWMGEAALERFLEGRRRRNKRGLLEADPSPSPSPNASHSERGA
jgi:hypothetical protein